MAFSSRVETDPYASLAAGLEDKRCRKFMTQNKPCCLAQGGVLGLQEHQWQCETVSSCRLLAQGLLETHLTDGTSPAGCSNAACRCVAPVQLSW